MRCQCPFGLLFISTAPFWKPRKQSIFQTFFAGIYLKILKTGIFRIIFVLFTICSYFIVLQEQSEVIPATLSSFKKVSTCYLLYYSFPLRKRFFVKSQ